MKIRNLAPSVFALAVSFVFGSAAFAQSLDPRNPAPLQPGTNSGMLDSNTGDARAVRFDQRATGPGLVVWTYVSRVGYHNDQNEAVKFKPDGTLEFAGGTVGTWKLFDENSMIYG